MNCQTIQEKLVAEESLVETERAHLESCPDCRAFAVTLEGVATAGAALAGFGPAPASEVVAVRQRIAARLAPKPLTRRLAYALPALALGAMGVVAMLTLGGRTDAARTGEAVFALMDEVDGIATPKQRVALVIAPEQAATTADAAAADEPATVSLLDEVDGITDEGDEEIGMVADLFGPQDDSEEEEGWELELPEGYQVLDDMLEERWL